MTIAQTILTQLGGNRFVTMTGARALVDCGNALQFKIGRGAKNGANLVKVTLDDNDTYTVEFMKLRGFEYDDRGTFEMVYGDQLQDIFAEETGFATRL